MYIQIQNFFSKFWSFFSVYSFSLLNLYFLILFPLVTVDKQPFQITKIHFIQFHYMYTQNICMQKYADYVQETVQNTFGKCCPNIFHTVSRTLSAYFCLFLS